MGVDDGRGIALKVEDGAVTPGYARGVAGLEILSRLGVLDADALAALASHARPQIKNVAGRVVGEARPAFSVSLVS
jgi:L-asparaginase II